MDKRSLVMNVQNRTIFERDNIEVLKGINSDSIDLIYLDPPFNSNKSYSAPIGSEAAGAAFKDSWTLDDVDNAWHGQIAEDYPSLYQCIVAAELAHGKAMKAYLIMMSIRMLEMHRILSPKGSIYLHCDPTASHYLKMMMDSVFGQDNFRNEIVWQRASGRAKGSQYKSKSLGKDTDNIFHYSKSNNLLHNLVTQPLSELEINEKFPYTDTNGRKYNTTTPLFRQPSMGDRPNLCYEYKGISNPHSSGWRVSKEKLIKMDKAGDIIWREGKRPLRKSYADNYKGKPIGSLWIDIPIAAGKERTGYPTQKPLSLLDRIIKASSNAGDVVLDPFCGCATTCLAAENLNRKWIGIDLSPKAVELVKSRIEKEMPLLRHLVGKINHRTDVPERTDTPKEKRLTLSGLFSKEWIQAEKNRIRKSDIVLSEAEMQVFVSYKHTLYGIQEGKCNGCQYLLPIRNLTIDHIVPRSADGTDDIDNLQLLCGACNSTKGAGTQEQLIAKLKNQGVLL
ncbi:hypothetical protein F4X73_15060 [Candidatus Poribacteria bacterium]|nr:hypothetical protein [Candidatus Poribacteria bacterium]